MTNITIRENVMLYRVMIPDTLLFVRNGPKQQKSAQAVRVSPCYARVARLLTFQCGHPPPLSQ